jgi:hypothetical protein
MPVADIVHLDLANIEQIFGLDIELNNDDNYLPFYQLLNLWTEHDER